MEKRVSWVLACKKTQPLPESLPWPTNEPLRGDGGARGGEGEERGDHQGREGGAGGRLAGARGPQGVLLAALPSTRTG